MLILLDSSTSPAVDVSSQATLGLIFRQCDKMKLDAQQVVDTKRTVGNSSVYSSSSPQNTFAHVIFCMLANAMRQVYVVGLLRLPVLLDVKGPVKLEVRLVVVIDELGHGVVVAASNHACWSRLRFD
jgi:hypothetical protein